MQYATIFQEICVNSFIFFFALFFMSIEFLGSFLPGLPEEQPDDSVDRRPQFADVCFEVEEYKFYGHQVCSVCQV